jgi:N-acetyl-gamma-glutamyl-phosphate reductase
MQMVRVAVVGGSGYAGGEVLRLLLGHPDVEIGAITANTSVGGTVGAHHPHLVALADRTFEPTDASVLAGHDVVVLALPHGQSAGVAAVLDENAVVVDLGADHRLIDPDSWAQFYGLPHAGTWPYGLPELPTENGGQRARLAGARRIAVPGCNATAVTLALAPGVAAGVVRADDVVAVLACAPSGAGRTLASHLLASEILGSASPYGVGGTHRHVPEIEQNLQVAGATAVGLSFTPTLVPMARGILATVTAPLEDGIDSEQVRAAWSKAYADEPFVHLLPPGTWPSTGSTMGSNAAHVQVAVDARAGRVVAICAIDNLGKGAAGAAVQCLNLALGLPETTGLTIAGVAP